MKPNAWNVKFVHDYFTLTTTVVLTDNPAPDAEEIVNTADAIILDAAGFSPLALRCKVLDIEELENWL